MSELLFHNATVLTMDRALPRAEALLVRDGRIAAVDPSASGSGERIDCEGGVLLPAFIDAHCHLLAYAASLRAVDCTRARSIPEIVRAIGERAAVTPAGAWVRAFGYEETLLAERRHPTRHDLDQGVPAHPVRLTHRSGHASVLNSAALRLARIDNATEEPPGGAIERDLSSGEPNGVLLGMERHIDALAPPMPYGNRVTPSRRRPAACSAPASRAYRTRRTPTGRASGASSSGCWRTARCRWTSCSWKASTTWASCRSRARAAGCGAAR